MAQVDRHKVEEALDRRLAEVRRTRDGMRREGEGMLSGELAHLDNHPADEGTETYERELEATTDVFLDEEERRIAEARRALAEGTYGTCADCGREIPGGRLQAVPEAVRCLDCQRRFEGLHSQRHPGRQDGPLL
jgi:RNA polymerase-binding transcription factor DksA